jgi:hypothetical protein
MGYSYAYGCRYSNGTEWPKVLMIVGGVLLVVLLIVWLIVEYNSTRTFMGRLSSKFPEVHYTHDEETTVIRTDAEGNTSISTSGSDETVAHIRYMLNFYDMNTGKLRSVSAGNFSARVPYVRADAMAYQRLMANHSEPAHYTYTKVNEEYLIDVRGWLLDGAVKDITLLKLVPKEK